MSIDIQGGAWTKGLRNQEKEKKARRGRKFNRRLSGFPYFKFTEYLTYKAALTGIKVIKIFENWTSQTCRKCNQRGTRRTQGLFVCKTCGEDNADRNASFNIAYRALGYISKVGVTVNIHENSSLQVGILAVLQAVLDYVFYIIKNIYRIAFAWKLFPSIVILSNVYSC
jgi:hypothetical protein